MTTARTGFGILRVNARQTRALMLLLLFLAVQAAAVSNALHQAFHPEACHAGHGCVITLLAQGQVDAPALTLIFAAFVAAVFFLLPASPPVLIRSVDSRQHPGRAPPRF